MFAALFAEEENKLSNFTAHETHSMENIQNNQPGKYRRGRDGWDFSNAGRAAQRDFLRAKAARNPMEQNCQPKENPYLPAILLKFTFYFN